MDTFSQYYQGSLIDVKFFVLHLMGHLIQFEVWK